MMGDIVERLRAAASPTNAPGHWAAELQEAADEIERLRTMEATFSRLSMDNTGRDWQGTIDEAVAAERQACAEIAELAGVFYGSLQRTDDVEEMILAVDKIVRKAIAAAIREQGDD